MFEKLEALLNRYNEIHRLMADNEIASDIGKCQDLAKELSSIEDIVRKYQEYKKTVSDLDETGKLLKQDAHAELVEMIKKELGELTARRAALELELEDFVLGEEEDADRDIIMEIRAGTGGNEASLFAGDLFRAYSKYAQARGWKTEIMDSHIGEVGGFKEIIFSVKGRAVYKRLKYERGAHRVQRVPATEASGRIHTSAVTVAVLPEAEEVDVKIDTNDLKIDTYRSSGAGGQHVNVTDSAVRITHLPTGIVVQCQNERSQYKNKASAMKVLRARLLENSRIEHEKKTASERKAQVGTGDRSEKIRTYNFPDRRVTDHRIGFTIHNLDGVMEGDMDEIIDALLAAEKKMRLGQLKAYGPKLLNK